MTNIFKRNPNRIRRSKLDLTVDIINIILLALGAFIVLFAILSFFALAFSDGARNLDVVLLPKGFNLKAFKYILVGDYSAQFLRSFLNSIIITVIVTLGSNLVEALAAYPLSKKDCPFRSGILMYFIITMLFSAGIVPIYLLMHMLGLLDTIWSIILCSISNVFNLLLFKTFFEGLPTDLEEAARLDGASEMQMFFRIVIPLSLPVFGSCCFFSMVGSWNSYGTALLFITGNGQKAWPLAYYIYKLVNDAAIQKNDAWILINIKNVQSAAILLSIIPILLVYPYIVKYLKSGLMLGSVKG